MIFHENLVAKLKVIHHVLAWPACSSEVLQAIIPNKRSIEKYGCVGVSSFN